MSSDRSTPHRTAKMTTTHPKRQAIQNLRQACSHAKYPLALAGAGLSASSGIPTFRGPGGLWRNHDPLSLATPQAFQNDPSKVWQFYHYRRELCLKAQPNRAHRALNWLGSQSGSEEVFKNAKERFRLITQNVDGLSVRAASVQGGEDEGLKPLEMHGSLYRTICTKCNMTESNFDSPIASSLKGTEDASAPLKRIPTSELPRCTRPSCGGLLRPGVVWFGESIPLLDDIEELISKCDLLLVLGTSSTVSPANAFAGQVLYNGGTVAVFNLEKTQEEHDGSLYFQGPVEETLSEAFGYDGP